MFYQNINKNIDITSHHDTSEENCTQFAPQCALIASHFHSPLHSPDGSHLPAVRAVQSAGQSDCHWGLKNGGNSHWSRDTIMQRGIRQSHSIFRPTNHKRVMPANRRSCLIPHWQSYIAIRLGLCSSLSNCCEQTLRVHNGHRAITYD